MIHNIGKLLINNNKITQKLVKGNFYQYFIYLKDHNKKINPEKTKLSLSFMDPKNLSKDIPEQKKFIFSLRKKTQRELQRKLFEQYKQKVLKGQIDQDEQVRIDPLWGEQQKPIHYYQTLNKVEIMKTSYPQSNDVQDYLDKIYKKYFSSTLTGELPQIGSLLSTQPDALVQIALLARDLQNFDRNYWYNLQSAFGNKFYKLSSQSLIKLNFALNGRIKMGTPKIRAIVNDLLLGDMPTLSKNQLINLFYSCRFLRRQDTPLLKQIVKNLQKFYTNMTIQEKINWLLTYTIGRRPSTLVQCHQKIRHQQIHKAHQILFNLQFQVNISEHLNDDLCIKLIYSLAKLRAKNTTFLTNQILEYIRKNFQSFSSNLQNLYKALFYLQEVNGGVGVYDEQLFKKFIEVLTKKQNFQQLDKYQKIKSIYAIWNYNLMDDNVFQIYKNIQIEADSTVLNYFCQIQLSRSSEREWQVLRCIAGLDCIPLPYFISYKRFYNYMKESTDWDLQPIQQKLRNTEYCFNAKRTQNQFYSYKFYTNMMKFLEFTGQISPFQHTFPIDNLQLAQFGNVRNQVSVDVIDETGFIPGTDQLKLIFVNKITSLKQLGWKHVYLREKQILNLPLQQQFNELIYAHTPYIQEQVQEMKRRGQIRAQQIQFIRQTDYWDNLVSQQAQGFRNNPQQYMKKVAQQEQRQKKLMQQIQKLG